MQAGRGGRGYTPPGSMYGRGGGSGHATSGWRNRGWFFWGSLIIMTYWFILKPLGFTLTATEKPSPEPSRAAAREPFSEEQEGKAEPLRLWTDSSGKYQVEAVFVECHDDVVRLRKADGRVVQVPVSRLGLTDADYVHRRTESVASQ